MFSDFLLCPLGKITDFLRGTGVPPVKSDFLISKKAVCKGDALGSWARCPCHAFGLWASPTLGNLLPKHLQLKYPTVFAPMEGVTHPELRRLMIAQGGLGMVCTEFVRVHGNHADQKHVKEEVRHDSSVPLSVQCMGNDPELLGRAAGVLAAAGAEVVDLNVGCPTVRAAKRGVGAALLKNPPLIYEILCAMRERVPGLLSAKIRAGFNDTACVLEIAQKVQEAGVDFITVHPRRRSDGYRGVADWRIIRSVKDALAIPVFGNGDCWYAEDALRMQRETGCDAVMIGRPALRNPWLFAQIASLLAGEEAIRPTGAEVAAWLRLVVENYQKYFAEAPQVIIGKIKELVRYLGRAVNDERRFMKTALRVESVEEVLAVTDSHLAHLPASALDLDAAGSLGLEISGGV